MIDISEAILAPVAGEEAAAADANLAEIARLHRALHDVRNQLAVAQLTLDMQQAGIPTTDRQLHAELIAQKVLRRYREGWACGVCPTCGMGRTPTGTEYHASSCALAAYAAAVEGGAA